jgi:hypothetical protein
MEPIVEPICDISKKISKICLHLRPYQALEYDPALGVVIITTDWSIPIDQVNQLQEILAQRHNDEKIIVRRFDAHYKISLIRSLAV